MKKLTRGFVIAALVLCGAAITLAEGCGGAPAACDNCPGKAWACQNPNGNVVCFNTEEDAANSACSKATHDIAKCE